MSADIKPFFFISIITLLFTFGCATAPREPATPTETAQQPVIPPQQAPETRPVIPPEQADIVEGTEEDITPSGETGEPRSTVPATEQTERNTYRATASLRLTEQARLMIESKRPDDAISVLEKAMNINPGNGQNYYYLAEAWIIKGNKAQALQFNRMADIYLGNDAGWKEKVGQQKSRIENME